jgi:hypothetical protein
MKALALIYVDEQSWDSLSDDERNAVYAGHNAFQKSAESKVLDTGELAPTRTATTVRVRGGETIVTDGPFAETKEALGGFYLLDVETLDEATTLVAQIPDAATGAIEIRAAHEEDA